MSNLQRWNPFKFRRKNTDEKKADAESVPEPGATLARPFGASPMARLMESFFHDPFFREPLGRAELDRWFGDFSPLAFRPTVDVVDEESHLRVSAELPGMDKEDLEVTLDRDTLTIRGEKKNVEETKENGCYRTERSYGFFSRSIPLPRDLDHESAEATFDKGVLDIRFAKAPHKEDGDKTIEIK